MKLLFISKLHVACKSLTTSKGDVLAFLANFESMFWYLMKWKCEYIQSNLPRVFNMILPHSNGWLYMSEMRKFAVSIFSSTHERRRLPDKKKLRHITHDLHSEMRAREVVHSTLLILTLVGSREIVEEKSSILHENFIAANVRKSQLVVSCRFFIFIRLFCHKN